MKASPHEEKLSTADIVFFTRRTNGCIVSEMGKPFVEWTTRGRKLWCPLSLTGVVPATSCPCSALDREDLDCP